MLRLSEDDAQAVDLFVEVRAQSGSPLPHADARLQRVGQVFQIISHMPASDPSWNLVARTLRRVNRVALEDQAQTLASIQPQA